MKEIFVLTGSTGWVGRNFLHELQMRYPPDMFNKRVIAFGSCRKNILSTAYPPSNKITIPIYPLTLIKEKVNQIENLNLIHTAFATREKINELGLKKYIETNQEITNNVITSIKNKKNVKSLIISSGAAGIFNNKNKTNKKLEKDPYGFLKLEEEKKFCEISNPLILRIYGLTGKFIRDPNIFAFGNFITSAIHKKRIVLKSTREVIRSYVFAGDIAKGGLSWLDSDNNNCEIINASTLKINLKDLAQRISDIYNLPDLISDINHDLDKDDYSCDASKFKKLLSKFSIIEQDLDTQIIETYKYLKFNLNKH